MSGLKASLCAVATAAAVAAAAVDEDGAEERNRGEADDGGGAAGGGGGEGDCELCCWLLDLLVRLVISHNFSGASFLKLACLNCHTVLFSADSS